jgi:hypothetical protein
MMRAMRLLLLFVLLPTLAHAGLKDVTVDKLEDLDPSRRQTQFDFVVRQLALATAAPPHHAVSALGLYELEVGLDNRIAFVQSDPQPGERSSAWQDLTEDGAPSPVQYVPRLTVRKGLPWAIEVGGSAGWLAATRQFVVGGYGRWAALDNWPKVPDLAIQMGYQAYVGNDQLDMGTFDLDVSLGYTFAARSTGTKPGSAFSPYVGWSLLAMHARPGTVQVDGVGAVTAWAGQARPGVDPRNFLFHRVFGGVEIQTGPIGFRLGGDVSFPRGGPILAAATLTTAIRF